VTSPSAEDAQQSASAEHTPERVASVRRDASKGKRRLESSVLAMEVVVFWLAVIVAIVQTHVRAVIALPVAGVLVLACLVVAARISRSWADRAGFALQVAAIASGIVVHAMLVVGVVFLALWVAAVRLGDTAIRRAEEYAAWVAAGCPPR